MSLHRWYKLYLERFNLFDCFEYNSPTLFNILLKKKRSNVCSLRCLMYAMTSPPASQWQHELLALPLRHAHGDRRRRPHQRLRMSALFICFFKALIYIDFYIQYLSSSVCIVNTCLCLSVFMFCFSLKLYLERFRR